MRTLGAQKDRGNDTWNSYSESQEVVGLLDKFTVDPDQRIQSNERHWESIPQLH